MRGVVPYEMTPTCSQGGIPRPLRGCQPNVMMEPSSPASAWQYNNTVLPKQEPMDAEERNDSGISGSDCQSPSPGSDHNDTIPYTLPTSAPPTRPPAFYAAPYVPMNEEANLAVYHQQSVNPLTPPNSEPMTSPTGNQGSTPPVETKTEPADHDTTLTPCTSPAEGSSSRSPALDASNGSENPLKSLEMTIQKTGLLPATTSPKPNRCSAEDEDDEMDSLDEESLRIPKINSHGKVKTYKCKQCDYVAITKIDHWVHTKEHIKPEKRLCCPKCPFVSEFKHHLEYHLLNHFGSKPFKCPDCNYACVNKSMLNSHLKSHSNVYQYHCSDCSYATKYCHSLKLHLRKYKHKPAMVLNPDGTPNPLPIIDVYGTRRGPKVRVQESRRQEETIPVPQPDPVLPFPLNQFMLNASQLQLPFAGFPFFAGFPGGMPNPLLLQHFEMLARETQGATPMQGNVEQPPPQEMPEVMQIEPEVLDLSRPEEPTKSRRKGRAYKLTAPSESPSDEEEVRTMFSNVEVVENKEEDRSEYKAEDKKEEAASSNNNGEQYRCQYCEISFGEPILYTIHMGYHDYNNPFRCNMCGEECKDKVAFFLHIARMQHS